MFSNIVIEEEKTTNTTTGSVEEYIAEKFKDVNIKRSITERFSTAMNIRGIEKKLISLVGLGGIGNPLFKMLVGMGLDKIVVYDPDTVEIHNVGPQGYSLLDVGRPKVEVAQEYAMAHLGCYVGGHQKEVHSIAEICDNKADILILAVDNMRTRIDIMNSFNSAKKPELIIDLRMSLGEWTAYIVPTNSRDIIEKYFKEALFTDEEAVREPCTERAILFTGYNIASYVGAFLFWYANNNCTIEGESEKDFSERKTTFSWKVTMSAMDFDFITPTPAIKKLRSKMAELTEKTEDKRRKVYFRDAPQKIYIVVAESEDHLFVCDEGGNTSIIKREFFDELEEVG